MSLRVNGDLIVTGPGVRIFAEFVIAGNVNNRVLFRSRLGEVTGIFVVANLLMIFGGKGLVIDRLSDLEVFWPPIVLGSFGFEWLAKNVGSVNRYFDGRMLRVSVIILAHVVRLGQ